MSRHWQQLQQAIDEALSEVAAAEAMAPIAREAEQHWAMALNYFLRCVEVCGNRREAAREQVKQEERRDWR
jgi:hypothetical protein